MQNDHHEPRHKQKAKLSENKDKTWPKRAKTKMSNKLDEMILMFIFKVIFHSVGCLYEGWRAFYLYVPRGSIAS